MEKKRKRTKNLIISNYYDDCTEEELTKMLEETKKRKTVSEYIDLTKILKKEPICVPQKATLS